MSTCGTPTVIRLLVWVVVRPNTSGFLYLGCVHAYQGGPGMGHGHQRMAVPRCISSKATFDRIPSTGRA